MGPDSVPRTSALALFAFARLGLGLRGLAACAFLVEREAEVLRREARAERARHQMPGAGVAILERRAREHALDRFEDVLARRFRQRDLLSESVLQAGLQVLAALARQH